MKSNIVRRRATGLEEENFFNNLEFSRNMYDCLPILEMYDDFVIENIEKVYNDKGLRDNTSKVNFHQLHSAFKSWYGDKFNSNRYPNSFLLYNEIVNRLGPLYNSVWYGIRLIEREKIEVENTK